jgi:hypothetical protein
VDIHLWIKNIENFKMKKLIVIDSYLTSDKKENILKEQIESLKNIGFDIMLVAHYPICTEIQFMVDYFIFDKNQTLDPVEDAPYYWFEGTHDSPFIRILNGRYRLAICQNMFNAFQFAEIKEYEFVYFLENDNFFSDNDAEKLNTLISEMLQNNKKCIFFKPPDYMISDSLVYETQIFGITPKYFNEIFKLPRTQEEWISYNMGFTLELAFYEKLIKYESNFLVINKHSSEYFSESKINQIRAENFMMELLYNIVDSSRPILFYHNNYKFEQRIIIRVNNNIILNKVINPENWNYTEFELNNDLLTLEVYDENDVLESVKSYTLDNNINDILIEKGEIDFNRSPPENK